MPRSPAVMTMSANFHDGGIFFVDASNLAPGAIPFLPGVVPNVRVEPVREIGNLNQRDLVGGERRRRSNAGALSVFLERGLRRERKIKGFDTWPIETATVDCRSRATRRQESPFGGEIAMEDFVGADAGNLHPRAPFSISRMKARTASTWPSATSSAAVRWS